MPLTQQQITLCRQALVDAFASRDELAMMLRVQLDEDLDAVAQGDNRTLLAFKLITWAERKGKVRALVNAIIAEQPDNPTVRVLAGASESWVLDNEAAPAPPVPAAAVTPAPIATADDLRHGQGAGEDDDDRQRAAAAKAGRQVGRLAA